MNNITGFTFFYSYYDALKDLEREDRKDVLEAIVDFIFKDEEPEFTGFKNTIWILMKPNLTASKNRAENAKKNTNQKKTKTKSKTTQTENKTKSKSNQNEIKSKSNSKQKENNDLLEDKDKNRDKNKNIELNKNLDMEEEQEKNTEKEENIFLSNINTTNQNIYDIIEANFERKLTPVEQESVYNWLDVYDEELVYEAVKISVWQNVKNFNYINGILKQWYSKGITTYEEYLNYNEKEKKSKESLPFDDVFDYDWFSGDDDE